MNYHCLRFVFLQFTLILCGLAFANCRVTPAQEITQPDLISVAQMVPPDSLSQPNLQQTTDAIEWRLKQLKMLQESYSRSKHEISDALAKLNSEAAELQAGLATEVRFTDAATRSQLVGRVVEIMLETKLELAAQEKTIELLEAKQPDDAPANSQLGQLEADVRIAEIEVESAEQQVVRAHQLLANQAISPLEIHKLENALKVAKLRLEQSVLVLKSAADEPTKARANRITELRLDILPLKAKLAAAEGFLEKFSDGAERLNKIEQISRERELWRKDLELVAGESASINREQMQLESLASQIKAVLQSGSHGAQDTSDKSKED
ncbi:MAG: hypothetical protein R3C53_08460 [Pirellulaceae bacterium]